MVSKVWFGSGHQHWWGRQFCHFTQTGYSGRYSSGWYPKTIDNDIGETETSIGFDTAVSVATEALDRLQPTAASHDRVMVLEVMGRDAGHIALTAGSPEEQTLF